MAWPFRQPDPDPDKEKKIAEQSKVERDEFIASTHTSFEETLKPIREDTNALKTSSTRTVPVPTQSKTLLLTYLLSSTMKTLRLERVLVLSLLRR